VSLALGVFLGLVVLSLAGPRRRPPGSFPERTPASVGRDRVGIARVRARSGAGRIVPRPRRRRKRESGVMIAVLAHVLALLGAGHSPGRAWREAAGVPTTLAASPSRASLDHLVAGPRDARAADAIIAVGRLSADVGAPVAEALARLQGTLEAEEELASERSAALAGPRASARVLTWLPIAGLVLGAAIGADPIGVLADGGIGSTVMLAGLGCHLLGRAVTGRLVRFAERAGDDP